METIHIESEVKSYSRTYPTTFCNARGSFLYDTQNKRYLDFFSGAGALNYGHNHPQLKKAVLEYISENGLIHGLDMDSTVRTQFLNAFNSTILKPRHMDYKIQFPGPTGTNAVEAAIRLARKVTGRSLVLSFTHGYHGMTQGALALTANAYYRDSDAVIQQNVAFLPFDGYLGKGIDTTVYIEKLLSDPSSGVDLPAAIIVETIQGEGGVNIASDNWLQNLSTLAHKHGVLLIIDDIQVGCGRTGSFFSFEQSGIEPDMILLSKSISGFGLPLSMVLLKPELDQWKPGEHTGTFRSNNLALVAATEALEIWKDPQFHTHMKTKSRLIEVALEKLKMQFPALIKDIRGKGMIFGVEFFTPEITQMIQKLAFERSLVIETSGAYGEVLKLLPPLTIENTHLQQGLDLLSHILSEISESKKKTNSSIDATRHKTARPLSGART